MRSANAPWMQAKEGGEFSVTKRVCARSQNSPARNFLVIKILHQQIFFASRPSRSHGLLHAGPQEDQAGHGEQGQAGGAFLGVPVARFARSPFKRVFTVPPPRVPLAPAPRSRPALPPRAPDPSPRFRHLSPPRPAPRRPTPPRLASPRLAPPAPPRPALPRLALPPAPRSASPRPTGLVQVHDYLGLRAARNPGPAPRGLAD
jgi:hypothetical protein